MEHTGCDPSSSVVVDPAGAENLEEDLSSATEAGTEARPWVLTLYEVTCAIGVRACQLDKGDAVRVPVGEHTDSLSLAFSELCARRMPMAVKRTSENGSEVVLRLWDPRVHLPQEVELRLKYTRNRAY